MRALPAAAAAGPDLSFLGVYYLTNCGGRRKLATAYFGLRSEQGSRPERLSKSAVARADGASGLRH